MEQQEDELSKIDTPDKPTEGENFDESSIKDEEVLDRVTRRFGRVVPLKHVNVILLMDMT